MTDTDAAAATRARQFGRFLVVGVWNTLFAYALFAVLNYCLADRMPFAYVAASAIASAINITVAYLGHKFLVFRTRGNYLREYLRYWVVYGTSALLGLLLLPLVVAVVKYFMGDVRSVPYIAQALLLGASALGSFIAHLRYSFGSGRRPER